MTEPSPSRPVPGPPRPDPRLGDAGAGPGPASSAQDALTELPERPVSEHVAVFETEHARLERELGTIDQL